MNDSNLWLRAQNIQLRISEDIAPGFDIGFDSKIPPETQKELRSFVNWVEEHFCIPITLWVDFEYNHYLLRRDKKRVGYLFYWSDFSTYPVFHDKTAIPIIRLPVRTEHSTMEEILGSFIEAISCYFAWLCNELSDDFDPSEDDVEEILEAYLNHSA